MAATPPAKKPPTMPRHVRLAQYYAFDLDGNVLRFPEGAADFVREMGESVEPGPAFADLADAFNRASVFFVVTKLGIPVAVAREGFRRFFASARAAEFGVDRDKFLAAMRYYFDLTGVRLPSGDDTFEGHLDYYVSICDFYPVADPQVSCLLSSGDETDVAKLKAAAMRVVLRSVVSLASRLPGGPRPHLAFSDDAPASRRALMGKFYGQASGVAFSVLAAPRAGRGRRPAKKARKGSRGKTGR